MTDYSMAPRLFPWEGTFTTKEEVEEYLSETPGIQCLRCGRVFKALGKHLLNMHSMNAREYKTLYGLPQSRGLIAADSKEKMRRAVKRRIADGEMEAGWRKLQAMVKNKEVPKPGPKPPYTIKEELKRIQVAQQVRMEQQREAHASRRVFCCQCGKAFCPTNGQVQHIRHHQGRAFCSDECRSAAKRELMSRRQRTPDGKVVARR